MMAAEVGETVSQPAVMGLDLCFVKNVKHAVLPKIGGEGSQRCEWQQRRLPGCGDEFYLR